LEYKLFRAKRTTKINAENFEAFESPNYPVIGVSGVQSFEDGEIAQHAYANVHFYHHVLPSCLPVSQGICAVCSGFL
jgi:L-asparaginase/Glu-tRNA(Gln) amidotransferase subunit D